MRLSWALAILGVIVLAALPAALAGNDYLLHVLILIMLFAVLGQSWNVLAGYAGQVSLGHNALFGMGAYASALLIFYFHVNPWATLAASAVFAVLLGLAMGATTFKLRGAYFALATYAFAEIVRLIIENTPSVTRGAAGVPVPTPKPLAIFGYAISFNSKVVWYYIALATMIVALYVTYRLTDSKYGLLLKSVMEDEDAAISLGVNSFRLKMMAMTISAALAGVAGGLYAIYIGFVDPTWGPGGVLSPFTGLDAVIIGILGGMGTVIGPVVGSLIRVGLGEYLRSTLGLVAGYDTFTFGVVIVAVILLLPIGVWGVIKERISRRG